MRDLLASIQNVVMLDVGECRVTFRVFDDPGGDRARWEKEDPPYTLYTMTARSGDRGFIFVGEGGLAECVKLFRDNECMQNLPESDHHKWKVGVLANDIMTSLADRGFMTAWKAEEEQ